MDGIENGLRFKKGGYSDDEKKRFTEDIQKRLKEDKEDILSKLKSSQCNVNSTMNQMAENSGVIDNDMESLASALKK